MIHFRTTYRILYAAALVWSCCFLYSCENSQEDIDRLTKKTDTVEEAIDVTSYMSQEGKMKARLTAPLMYRGVTTDTQFVEFPRKLHVDFYNDSTVVDTWLDAKYGKYYELLDKVYLRDSVVIITTGGDTLRCHDLWWDQNKAIFYTDNAATYKSPGNDITGGKGMEATQDLKSVTFKEPLGNMKISDSGFAE